MDVLSMHNPFARMEERINEAALRRLANAMAVFNGGPAFGVIFDRDAHDAMGVGGYTPTCTLSVDRVPGLRQGGELVVDGEAFEVVEPIEPDRSGWATLKLREVPHG